MDRICKILWFNIGEEEWDDGFNLIKSIKNQSAQNSVFEMEQVLLLYAEQQDIVILRKQPDQIVLKNVEILKKFLPEIYYILDIGGNLQQLTESIINNNKLIKKINLLKKNYDVILVPYMVNKEVKELADITKCKVFGGAVELTKLLNSKIEARNICKKLKMPITEGMVCNNVNELEKFGMDQLSKGFSIIIKKPYGASAKGLFITNSIDMFNILLKRIKKYTIQKELNIIIEKWYEKVYDINYQVIINNNGRIKYIKPKRQIIKAGVYMGSTMEKEFLTKVQQDMYIMYAKKIGNYLFELGYRGVASIDSIITNNGVIYPIVEINARFSLSTYISRLPYIFGEDKKYESRYFNIKSEYENELVYIINELFSYTNEKKSGIVVYSFTSYIKNIQIGRVFFLIIAQNNEELNIYESIINILS